MDIRDLADGQVVGAEALARFTAPTAANFRPSAAFLDALGVALELAVLRLALGREARVPEGRCLALNVSPAVLEGDDLAFEIAGARTGRPLVVEITEHQPVDDYVALSPALDRLRELGVRVALDRTLVCGIDDDPVRQSLAAAIVAFAGDVGATVESEGIESESELSCLRAEVPRLTPVS